MAKSTGRSGAGNRITVTVSPSGTCTFGEDAEADTWANTAANTAANTGPGAGTRLRCRTMAGQTVHAGRGAEVLAAAWNTS